MKNKIVYLFFVIFVLFAIATISQPELSVGPNISNEIQDNIIIGLESQDCITSAELDLENQFKYSIHLGDNCSYKIYGNISVNIISNVLRSNGIIDNNVEDNYTLKIDAILEDGTVKMGTLNVGSESIIWR